MKRPVCRLIAILLWCSAACLIAASCLADDPIVVTLNYGSPLNGCVCHNVYISVTARDFDSTTSGVGPDDIVFIAPEGWEADSPLTCDEEGFWHQRFKHMFDAGGPYSCGITAHDLDIYNGENDNDGTGTTTGTIRDFYAADPPISRSITNPPNGITVARDQEVTCSAGATDNDTKNCTIILEHTPLTYSWSANGGSFKDGETTGADVTWIAPATAGSYTVSVTVTDPGDTPGQYCGTRADAPAIKSITMNVRNVIYVKPDGSGGGSSWTYALGSVGDALTTANSGDDVWVAGDTDDPYTENITLKAGVGLYGGFAEGEVYREQRDWRQNETTLEGQGTYQDPASVVTVPDDSGDPAAIDGFTITGGRAVYGGAVICQGSSPTIENNVITGNTAYGDGFGTGGGAVYCLNSHALIANNDIRSNSAYGLGGGIYCDSCAGVRIINNLIVSNHAVGGYSGGAASLLGCSGLVVSNTIVDNHAGTSGAAVYVAGYYSPIDLPVVANNIIAFNSAGLDTDSATVNHNVFYDGEASVPPDNILADPFFLDKDGGDYHLSSNSPCIDAGTNDYAQPTYPDMDGGYRVYNEVIDIGADETVAGCTWYTISLSAAAGGHIGDQVLVTGKVVRPPDTPIPNWPVIITVSGGTLVSVVNGVVDSPTQGHGTSDQSGEFYLHVRRDTPGSVIVTAEAGNACGTGTISDDISLVFFDPNVPVEMFFCIDATYSMATHFPVNDITELLEEMDTAGTSFRAGVVVFNPGGFGCDDSTSGWLFRSLNDFTTLQSFEQWLPTGWLWWGGDPPELQLDALHAAAQDMNAYSTAGNPRRYIIVVTE